MRKFIKFSMAALVVAVAASSTGCAAFDRLHADAVADRAANPEKYKEIPSVKYSQMSGMENGPSYPDSCAFGCPETPTNVTKAW